MEIIVLKKDYRTQSEFTYFFTGDLHSDSPLFDRATFLQDFEKAKKLNADIFLIGDIASLILSHDRKRHSKSNDTDLNQAKINTALYALRDLFEPYCDLIQIIGIGNHESSVLKYHDIDIIDLLITLLNEKRNKSLPPIVHGGYEGYIKLSYTYGKNGKNKKFVIFYNHGQGGNAEVTDGIIDLKRYAVWKAADLIWIGHKHKRLVVELPPLEGLSHANTLMHRRRFGMITGCYEKQARQYNIKEKGYQIDFGEERLRTPQIQHGIFAKQIVKARNFETEFIF